MTSLSTSTPQLQSPAANHWPQKLSLNPQPQNQKIMAASNLRTQVSLFFTLAVFFVLFSLESYHGGYQLLRGVVMDIPEATQELHNISSSHDSSLNFSNPESSQVPMQGGYATEEELNEVYPVAIANYTFNWETGTVADDDKSGRLNSLKLERIMNDFPRITDPFDVASGVSLSYYNDSINLSNSVVISGAENYGAKPRFRGSNVVYCANVGRAYFFYGGVVYNNESMFGFRVIQPKTRIPTVAPRVLKSPTAIVLADRYSHAIQHLPFSLFPLLVAIEPFLHDEKWRSVPIILDDTPHLRALVPFVGIPVARVIWVKKNDLLLASNLIIPVLASTTTGPVPYYKTLPDGGCADLGRRMTNGITNSPSIPSDSPLRNQVVYLTRGTTGKRGVANDDEILSMLRLNLRSDLELVIFHATGNIFEDAAALGRARLIMGPHGGAFLNMMYLPAGLDVVEFNNYSKNLRPCFLASARCFGLRYWVVEAVEQINYYSGTMNVSADAVADVLGQIGVLKSHSISSSTTIAAAEDVTTVAGP